MVSGKKNHQQDCASGTFSGDYPHEHVTLQS